MRDKKSNSRIINEMLETLQGLHRSGVLSAEELKESWKMIEDRINGNKSIKAMDAK